jgi:hypothetical protein
MMTTWSFGRWFVSLSLIFPCSPPAHPCKIISRHLSNTLGAHTRFDVMMKMTVQEEDATGFHGFLPQNSKSHQILHLPPNVQSTQSSNDISSMLSILLCSESLSSLYLRIVEGAGNIEIERHVDMTRGMRHD